MNFGGLGSGVSQIALGIIGVATAVVVLTSGNTSSIISAIGDAFSGSLGVAMGSSAGKSSK